MFVCAKAGTWSKKQKRLQDSEFEMPQHRLGTSSVATHIAFTKVKLRPTEIHWTSHFYTPFTLFSARCQPQVYSVLATEIFLHFLESNRLP